MALRTCNLGGAGRSEQFMSVFLLFNQSRTVNKRFSRFPNNVANRLFRVDFEQVLENIEEMYRLWRIRYLQKNTAVISSPQKKHRVVVVQVDRHLPVVEWCRKCRDVNLNLFLWVHRCFASRRILSDRKTRLAVLVW